MAATPRQKKAVELVVESRGKKGVSRAMLEAGYEPATAKNPRNLTTSKAWKELMEEYLPDDFVLSALKEDIALGEPGKRTPQLQLAAKLKGRITDRVEVEDPTGLFGKNNLTITVVDGRTDSQSQAE